MFNVGLVEEFEIGGWASEGQFPRYEIVIEPNGFIEELMFESLKTKQLIVRVKGIGVFEYKRADK